MKKLNWSLAVLIIAVAILFFGVCKLDFSSFFMNADVEEIKQILIKSETIADRTYIDVKKNYDQNTLKENKDHLIYAYRKEFEELFSEKQDSPMERAWIDRQIENVKDGPDMIECEVTNFKTKSISIKNDTANVSAIITKYLVDRVSKDGKKYLDRMEGEVLVNAKLIKVDNQWKILNLDTNPEYGETKHTLTEEK